MKRRLLRMIQERSLVCGVVGLGYVGLPLAVEKAKAGFRTIGFDIQPERVAMVNQGQNYIGDVVDQELGALTAGGMLAATEDFELLKAVDFIAVCVPTPLDENRQPDLRYIRESAAQIARRLRRGTIVVLESTSYPGTTEELLRPILEQGSGMKCGEDFYLGFSPERVDPGNLIYRTCNTPRVVGGIGRDATEVIAALYRSVLQGEVFEVSRPAAAEMEKLLENSYRSVNIALANEMAMLCGAMGLDVWEVVEAAKTKPYGFTAFYPGPGIGGHCIPVDPVYLSWRARAFGCRTQLLESAAAVNDRMPEDCAARAARMLNAQGKAVFGSKILALGAAYKQEVADFRESPAVRVIELLREQGARLSFYDPYLSQYVWKGKTRLGLPRLTGSAISEADLVLILTAHAAVDYSLVQKNARQIFDTKNAMKEIVPRENITVL